MESAAVRTNRDRARNGIRTAAEAGADLVALPESFTVGYFAFETGEPSPESLRGPTLEAIPEMAIEHDVAVLAGSLVEDLAATADCRGADPPASERLAKTSVLTAEVDPETVADVRGSFPAVRDRDE
ncbi:nitrilase-related carbon-nitrogen hydrolase [Halorhabdus rudnickae]|uniref:nitrilase-related carbon-nitrogen hydrolase n=1 Tax=Halorhabdus rudnickae TaxID=1775544 RepID=UPI0024529E9A|nr:nitrilase-related carbon-nitrogen hydrolase [Halorhabdus rudnickae]